MSECPTRDGFGSPRILSVISCPVLPSLGLTLWAAITESERIKVVCARSALEASMMRTTWWFDEPRLLRTDGRDTVDVNNLFTLAQSQTINNLYEHISPWPSLHKSLFGWPKGRRRPWLSSISQEYGQRSELRVTDQIKDLGDSHSGREDR